MNARPGYSQVTVRRESDGTFRVRSEDATGSISTYSTKDKGAAMAEALARMGRLFDGPAP